jgi:putative CocE/NonD family hydrolase
VSDRSNSRPGVVFVAALLALTAGSLAPAHAQGPQQVRARYEKREVSVPMRDGVKLFTTIYEPRDRSRNYPILIQRTPYSVQPYGADSYRADLGPSPLFFDSGYIFVYQDVRGRWMSEGDFVNMRPIVDHKADPQAIDESTDTFDTISWLLTNVENHNGRVGQWGISYPGFYTSCGLIDVHPALVAASPQAPIVDWFVGDDFHHNGALFLPHAFNFLATFGRPRPGPTNRSYGFRFDHGTPDGYQFFLDMGPLSNADARYYKGSVAFWNEMLEHDTYDDWWKARNLRPHLKNIRPAVMTVGGWFDAENLYGALETYKTIERSSPEATNRLVMGPWYHGGWAHGEANALGPIEFGAATGPYYRQTMEFPFFQHYLKGIGPDDASEARVFETGRNAWRSYDTWPPKQAAVTEIYLCDHETLAFEPAAESGAEAFDAFVSDPHKPVPFVDETVNNMTIEYKVEDQRFAARRPDVLVYETAPLEAPLTVAGPIDVDLQVSTTGTDADWVVKVIDVYPPDAPDPDTNPRQIRMGGYQQLVRGDVLRGKFRNSYETPEPFVPGQPTPVVMHLNDVNHTFLPGHRLMVQVQSSWFPLVDRNPQTFLNINKATADDFHKAEHRVYRSRDLPSKLRLPILPQPVETGETR